MTSPAPTSASWTACSPRPTSANARRNTGSNVARYAESNGYESDGERPNAWRFRDYVVKAFNDDMPYDRFLTEQLAGDLMTPGANATRLASARTLNA